MIILDNDIGYDDEYDYWLLESTYLSDNLSVFQQPVNCERKKNNRVNISDYPGL